MAEYKLTAKDKKDLQQVDDIVAERLKEDSIIGRWVRECYPEQHEKMLERAKQSLKFNQLKRREARKL